MSAREYTIGIDCRFAGTRSGIGRYTEELVKALLKRDDPWRYVFFISNNDGVGALGQAPLQSRHLSVIAPFPYYSLSEQFHFPRLIKQHHIDLLHVPHFNVPLLCPTPFVVTIHDLILHRYPNQASLMKRLAYRILMHRAMKKSSHIFAVSAFTAGEIKRTYGEEIGRKTTVTYEGVSDVFRPASEVEKTALRKKYDLPSSFFLYTGACKEHKNVQALIDAIMQAQTLVLVTGGKEKKRLRLKANVRILSDVPDRDLPILMSAAAVYVQPSFYEGFGLPVLEAMACGTQVVASNRTSIPEIAGGFATLVEPTIEGLREGIKMASNEHREEAMRSAQGCTWEKTAEQTARVYATTMVSRV